MSTVPKRSGDIDPIQPTLYVFRRVEGAVESEWRGLEPGGRNPVYDRSAITAIAAVMLCLSDANRINVLAAVAGVIGTAGGIAWIAAAAIGVRET